MPPSSCSATRLQHLSLISVPVQVFPSLLLSFLSVGGLRGWYVGRFAKINNWSSTLGQLSAFQYIVENVCVYVFYLTKRNCVT